MRQVLLRPSPLKKEKGRKRIRVFFILIIILFALFIGLGFLSHLPRLVINNVEGRGLKIIDSVDLEEKTLKYLSSNSALFYAKGNIFLYSKSDIVDFVKKEFPRVYSVHNIEREKQTIYLDIEEREAAYLWCGEIEPDYSKQYLDKECYFIDQTGFIFDQAPFFTDGVYFTVYGGINNESSPIGQTVIMKNSIADIVRIVDLLKQKNIHAHSVVLKSDSQNFFLLDNETSFNNFSKIFFNEDESLDVLYEKINVSLSEVDFIKQFELRKSDLEYIDTRFKNRVFYKFVNE